MNTKSENRKALPKFFLIILCSLVVGVLLGIGIAFAEGGWTRQFTSAVHKGLVAAAPWLLWSLAVLTLGAVLIIRHTVKRRLAVWQEEDEEALQAMDGLLNIGMLVNNVFTIFSYFLAAVPLCCFQEFSGIAFIVSLAGFIACMAVMTVGQQLLVDLTKKLYPEKQGSVYDPKFQKTWYASCDEAERAMIGQAAMTAYKAGSYTCLLLWLILVFGNLLFDFGLMPIAVVMAIWLVMTVSYTTACMRLEQRKVSAK